MNKPRYLVDGKPCTMNGIVRKAEKLNANYKYSLFDGSQRAMRVLRDNGVTIEENPKQWKNER